MLLLFIILVKRHIAWLVSRLVVVSLIEPGNYISSVLLFTCICCFSLISSCDVGHNDDVFVRLFHSYFDFLLITPHLMNKLLWRQMTSERQRCTGVVLSTEIKSVAQLQPKGSFTLILGYKFCCSDFHVHLHPYKFLIELYIVYFIKLNAWIIFFGLCGEGSVSNYVLFCLWFVIA